MSGGATNRVEETRGDEKRNIQESSCPLLLPLPLPPVTLLTSLSPLTLTPSLLSTVTPLSPSLSSSCHTSHPLPHRLPPFNFYTPLALILLSEQVLTHTREKLRFYEKSNKVSQVRLTELEEKTLCLRGEVSSCKQLRDATRDEKKELKVRQGFANNELLINDFENRKRDILCTADRIADLQSRHHSLSLLVASFPPAPVAFPAHSSSSSTLRGGSSGNVQDTHTRTNTRSPLALL